MRCAGYDVPSTAATMVMFGLSLSMAEAMKQLVLDRHTDH